MTLTIEVDDEKALDELKDFLEAKKEIRVMPENGREGIIPKPESVPKTEMTDEERKATLRSLYGAIPYDEEKYNAQVQFLQEIRNEWER